MQFRTDVNLEGAFNLSYADTIVSLGSCFADNIGSLLHGNGFRIEQNPFGTLYNPMSIIKNLERLWNGDPYTEEELFEYQGVYGSFSHHTSFSGHDAQEVLDNINSTFTRASKALHEATCLMLTFGTAWVYSYAETGRVVANCHKLPADLFVRRRLEVGEIVDYYREALTGILAEKPELKIVLTVSPIRHFKDGAHENTLSKSVLHLAIDELCLDFPDNITYFPAYELLMDELRDYRFYSEDMLHPSSTALKYIYERFSDFAFDPATKEVMVQLEQIHKAMAHKPFHPQDDAYLRFAQKNLAAISLLQSRCPQLNLEAEKDFFESALHL